jgi:LacI family transcriptional regulator
MLPPSPSTNCESCIRQARTSLLSTPASPLTKGSLASPPRTPTVRAATDHLLALGHRRIGVITGPAAFAATRERLLGVEGALAGARVLLERTLIAEGDWQIASGIEAARRLLARPHRPTAIFAFNDEMAVGVLRAAGSLGIRVPEDLSVVDFDDLDRAELLTPQLTTVRQPLAEKGRMAVSLLLRLLAGRRLDALRFELATALVIRQSTAAVPSEG